MATKKKSTSVVEIFWPSVDNLHSAKRAARYGFYAAAFVAAITGLVALLSFYGVLPVDGVDIYALIDAAIIGLIALGIWYFSRTAAVIALVFFIGEKIYMLANGVGGEGIVLSLVLLLCFVNGVRGTFAYQRLRRT